MIFSSSLEKLGKKKHYSTNEIKALLKEYGNPQENYEVVLVTGSNGKGSTTAFLSSILKQKYRVGSYYSPHVESFNERIAINGKNIEDEEWRALESIALKEGKRKKLSFFEAMTFMAYLYFAEEKVEIAVVEVGMGGRLDATNVVNNKLALLSSLSKEHTQWLGNSIESIAKEKLEVAKRSLVAGKTRWKKLVKRIAKEKGIKAYFYGEEFEAKRIRVGEEGTSFLYKDKYNSIKLKSKMVGYNQAFNASLATFTSLFFPKIGEREIEKGIREGFVPARFEIIKRKPLVILDGSHNREGITMLLRNYNAITKEKAIVLFGVMKDKDWKAMLKKINRISHKLIVTKISEMERSESPTALAKFAKKLRKEVYVRENEREALIEAMLFQKVEKKPLLITGSFYLAGRLRRMIKRLANP